MTGKKKSGTATTPSTHVEGSSILDSRTMGKKITEFLAEDGPWKKLIAAKVALEEPLARYVNSPEYRAGGNTRKPRYATNPHRADLTAEESAEMLIGHTGLNGEYGNAVQSMINIFLDPKGSFSKGPILKKLDPVVKAFDVKSQLSGLVRTGLAEKSGALKKDASGAVIYQESKIEALWRCADTIEQWVKANPDVIAKEDQALIAKNLADYRAALPEVLAFADQARQFVANPPPSRSPRVSAKS